MLSFMKNITKATQENGTRGQEEGERGSVTTQALGQQTREVLNEPKALQQVEATIKKQVAEELTKENGEEQKE